ncbi:MAG: HEXXH motif-containing putative peptide modification protein [Candidatus Gracilibacteria bacterium]|nr:HEXXH motif-containing putative peptide modification protein [Candidatus Gracilibacteria bacterium]
MKLNYYVLGTQDNIMLNNYLNKYYNLLITYLVELSGKGILIEEITELLKKDNINFILNPDYSSIINLLYKEIILISPQYLGNIDNYINKLGEEINYFINNELDKLSSNQGNNILGTNIKLTNIDLNPYNIMEAHPDHKISGVGLGWGDRSELEWLNIYEKTFELLKKVDIGIYTELNMIIKKIVPLGTSKGVHNSCSYKECIGHIYLGYTIDSSNPEINNLEAIIHESSHNKLNLIMHFDPIILNTKEEKYYSAIRPDARHIHGVFIGYHAFAPTMYILMKAYRDGYFGNDLHWLEKIVLYHIKTKFLQKVIKKYAKLTQLGIEISEEIDYVITLMDDILRELNPSKDIIKIARNKQIEHFKQVNFKYPHLEY